MVSSDPLGYFLVLWLQRGSIKSGYFKSHILGRQMEGSDYFLQEEIREISWKGEQEGMFIRTAIQRDEATKPPRCGGQLEAMSLTVWLENIWKANSWLPYHVSNTYTKYLSVDFIHMRICMLARGPTSKVSWRRCLNSTFDNSELESTRGKKKKLNIFFS